MLRLPVRILQNPLTSQMETVSGSDNASLMALWMRGFGHWLVDRAGSVFIRPGFVARPLRCPGLQP